MTINADIVADRRRIKRSNMIWRAIAILAVIAAVILAGIAGIYGNGGFGVLGNHIARVQVEGLITGPREQLAMFKKLEKNERVRAVLVHVNSPGGTTAGSEAVYEQLRKIAKKKPVVTVLGSQATSGGYITAIAGDYIISRGNTLTGSIGVIFQWPNAKELLDKIGIKYREVKSDPLKATPNPFSDASPEAIAILRDVVDDSQDWFIGLVSERRNLDNSRARALGNGRIYTGRQALAAKLVDAIGGETEAINWLQTEKKLPKSMKIVNWTPRNTDEFSYFRLSATWIGEVFGGAMFNGLLAQAEKRLASERLRLDGLVSVWQPKE